MTTREDIIKMAREAGAIPIHKEPRELALVKVEIIKRFFHMAQAAEREEIAKMFDEPMRLVPFVLNHQGGCMICGFTPTHAAAAIRARGNK